ncbi:hypothetical protein [Sphingomonas sp. LM7]|uniref:hypothetical protein n=1 Tax=Sphingomonas sp. LM7 TaxID=1938607 RepID=UPI000983CFA3|nr:hypothetical protein [Sphingomonas sp. LM7]AQR75198.1 hypothetical protein BXU08_17375 [Sphingomonas sp. LM7]
MSDAFLLLLDDWHVNAKPVCGDDNASQIAWLESNATPELNYYAVLEWNWDHGIKVLQWLLEQPETSASAAAYQLTTFVGAGAAGERGVEVEMMRDVAAKLRTGFYRDGWGLPPSYEIPAAQYREGVRRLPESGPWDLPGSALGPFASGYPERPDVMFDGDGRIRLTMEAWKARHPDRFR